MTDTSENSRPVAYSYVRFSTARQEMGDSLRRQVEMAEDYAAKHNLKLSEKSFRDLGVSGFKGRNAKDGALGAFISAVRSGAVAPGSVLLIEQFDRLSRDQVTKALRLLLDLVEAGITVVTLVDEKVWDEKSVEDVTNVLVSVILMSRAHEESKSKAGRLRKIWRRKKLETVAGEAKRIVTSECPRWLQPTEDKTGFTVKEALAESIRKVFDLRIKGMGVSSIVTKANAEGWPCPGNPSSRKADETREAWQQRVATATIAWHTSTVGRLLKNRALIGEYQPHATGEDRKRAPDRDKDGNLLPAVKDYYPAVLDEATFLRAQAVSDRRGQFPGRRDASYKNWLQGLLRCNCGASMVRKNKNSLAQPGYSRYYCASRNRGLSQCPGVNAGELERAVLYVVTAVAPEHVDGSSRADELKVQLDVLDVEASAAQATLDNFLTALGTGSKATVGALMKRVETAQATVDELQAKRRTLQAELADINTDVEGLYKGIVERAEALSSLEDRAELREALARVVRVVDVHEAQGYVRVWLRGNDEVPVVHPMRPDAQIPGLEATAVH